MNVYSLNIFQTKLHFTFYSYSIAFCKNATRFCRNGVLSSMYLRAVFTLFQSPSLAICSSDMPSLAARDAPPLLLECSEKFSPSCPA